MGQLYSFTYYGDNKPDYIPDTRTSPTFDPHFGFKSKRIERGPKLSEKEYQSLKIKPSCRDYCTHLLADLYMCQRNNLPFINMFCRKEIALYKHCRHEDYVLRMKEYEREKRLRIRQKKLEGKLIK